MIATRQGIILVFGRAHLRLGVGSLVTPLDEMAGFHDIYTFNVKSDVSGKQMPTLAMSASSTAERWHQRLGHAAGKTLDILRKTPGTEVSFEGSPLAYEVWKLSKSKQQPHHTTSTYNVSAPFEFLIGNLMGPISSSALEGFQYVSEITDVFSRWTSLYLMKSRSDTLDTSKTTRKLGGDADGKACFRLRTDEGGEHIRKESRD